MRSARPALILVAAASLAAMLALAPSRPAQSAEGPVRVDGSSTVFPFAEAVAEEFSKKNPKAKVTVGQSGTGGGFKRFGSGEVDMANASRPIKAGEVAECAKRAIEFVELPVAFDGLTIVVNKANSWATQMTIEQIRKVYSADGGAKTWKDIDPSWPDERMKIYSPGTDSGTFDYFKEVVVGKEGKIRGDMSVSEDDNVLVRGVEGDRNAIGFFGFAYFTENQGKLRAVPVVNPKSGTAVTPTHDSIEDGSYAPFGRPLFVYVSKPALAKPAVAAYAAFMLEHAGELAEEVGYVKLPAAVYDRARANLKAGRAGTQFIGPDGKDVHGPIAETYR
ncbi:MAG: PstS family phosphate ABC transporter substrate-binding protein [Phycisphaerales bacterium]